MRNTIRAPKNGSAQGAVSQTEIVPPETVAQLQGYPPEKREYMASYFEQCAAICRGSSATRPKIPKGFVLVNLSTGEQKTMREAARACGTELRTVLGNTLRQMLHRLKQDAKLARITGLTGYQLYRAFDSNRGRN